MPKKNEKKAQGEPLPEQEQPLPEGEGAPQSKEAIVLHPGSSTLYFGFATDSLPQSIPHIIAYRTCATTLEQDTSRIPPEQSHDSKDASHDPPTASHDVDNTLHDPTDASHDLNTASRDPEDKSHDNVAGSHDSNTVSPDMGVVCEQGTQSCGSTKTKEDPSLVLEHEIEMTSDLEGQREEGLLLIQQALAQYRTTLGVTGSEAVDRKRYAEYNNTVQPKTKFSDDLSLTDLSGDPNYIIGNEVLYLPSNSGYKVCKPIRKGQLNTTTHSLSCVLSQLEDLWTRAIEEYLDLPRKEFKHYQVVLLVSDIIDRKALKEMMNVLFRMEFSAAIIHQESVCATYCAGLSSACVVNVGDEATHICCVEDGMSNPNTRVVLHYGGSDITRLFYWLINQTNFPYRQCRPDSCLDGVLLQQLKESVCSMDATQSGVHDYQFSVISKTPGQLLDYDVKLSDEALLAPMGVFFPSSFCLPDNCELMAGQPALSPASEDVYDEDHWTEGQSSARGGLGSEFVAPEAARRLKHVPLGKILSLDQAIHFSIDCASSQDMKKKLYGSILLVGGGLSYPGGAAMLQGRLETRLPPGSSGGVEVFKNPRELESNVVCWKGGSILRCLDTTQELWVERQEWEFYGVRVLRERAPFQW